MRKVAPTATARNRCGRAQSAKQHDSISAAHSLLDTTATRLCPKLCPAQGDTARFTTQATTDSTGGIGPKADGDDPPVPPLQAGPGVTALSGQVRTVAGKYLPQVTLELNCGEVKAKSNRAVSDGTGRFLLANVPQGHCKLEIDGTTVHRGTDVYTPANARAVAQSKKSSFFMWLTSPDYDA